VIPANATSVSPTQAMGKPSNTAAAFLFQEVYMSQPRNFIISALSLGMAKVSVDREVRA